MIRYATTLVKLKERVSAADANWLRKAQEQTKALKDDPSLQDFPSLWSDIKQVYIDLQHSKCAFCERVLEGVIEQDVEHFRPKAKVTRWRITRALTAEGVTATQPADGSEEGGYRLLAYHLLNYAMACKNCNTILKKNLFPIAGARKNTATNPARITGEKPYLVYPLGDHDDDPETLIDFRGLSPRAKQPSGFARLRALVTIEVFRLDDYNRRKALFIDRAEFLEKLYFALKLQADSTSSADRMAAQTVIDRLTSERSRHTNCLRCFRRLFQADRAEAERLYDYVRHFLESVSL